MSLNDLILDEDDNIEADLVVLATGMIPNSGRNNEWEDELNTQKTPPAPSTVMRKASRNTKYSEIP